MTSGSYSQSGAKWATGGNSIGTSDVLGTINNFPLLFHTNNTLKMTLSTTGVLQLNNLSGIGNRLLQTDAAGNITPFTMGTATQVLYGNGTWGSIPTTPSSFWSSSGSKIYYNLGNVGIGTSSPAYPLEVIGDVRISNNLYVGGGIVITDKVNASSEVVTSRVKTDSIVVDSTMGFYGTTKFNGDVKLQNKLNVHGDVKVSGIVNFSSLSSASPLQIVMVDNFGNLKLMAPSTPGCAATVPWLNGGNVVSTIAESYLGTCNSMPLILGTNTFERMRITPGGNIGIGTMNPLSPFYVQVPTTFVSAVGIGTTTPSGMLEVVGDSKISGNTLVTGNSIIDGRVGIAANTPEDLFQVGSQSAKVDIGPATGLEIGYGTSYIGFNTSHQNATGISTGTWSTATDFANNGGALIYSTIFGDMLFTTIPTTGSSNQTGISDATIFSNVKFLINKDGNVGIGLNTIPDPNYKLTVCGAMHAKRVVVSLGWCDFVFDKNYKLRTLEETEKYIKVNGHLPEIPSAKEVETDGGDLGELVKLQMQKIEELTLYLIEQNKKIELLEQKINFKK